MATKTQIKSRGWHNVTVDGNLITGDTFKCSDFIKKQLAGKWDARSKGWRVDLDLLAKYTHPTSGVIGRW